MNPSLPCLEDERSLAGKLGIPLPPLCKFDLASWGIDPQPFLRDLAPSFDVLDWDYYDVRAKQLQLLEKHDPEGPAHVQELTPIYYTGRGGHKEVQDLVRQLPATVRQAFEKIQPYRRRSAAAFTVTYDVGGSPRLERIPMAGFSQNVGKHDYRSQERVFPEAADEVIAHPGFQQLLGCVALTVRRVEGDCPATRIVFHQMRTVVRPGSPTVVPPGEPTQVVPEGIHQDGAQYIISALVVEREGVTGGESIVYGPDKRTPYLATVLQPGEGIFQADTGSPLWHYVTPISFDPSGGHAEGKRSIFGFDVHLTPGWRTATSPLL